MRAHLLLLLPDDITKRNTNKVGPAAHPRLQTTVRARSTRTEGKEETGKGWKNYGSTNESEGNEDEKNKLTRQQRRSTVM
jgi:hypothetical protein